MTSGRCAHRFCRTDTCRHYTASCSRRQGRKSIRYPDFNSLFWKGDARSRGNPELWLERNKAWNFQIAFRPANSFIPRIQLRHYRESISDLIFWHRAVNGFWEPRNLYLAKKNGFDLELSKSLRSGTIDLQTAYNFNDATNLSGEPTTDGKRIIFIPLVCSARLNSAFCWIIWVSFSSQIELVPSNNRILSIRPCRQP